MSEELKERVIKFRCWELPDQPLSMHMGTSYLVNDLAREIEAQAARIAELRAALKLALRRIVVREKYAAMYRCGKASEKVFDELEKTKDAESIGRAVLKNTAKAETDKP